MRPFFPSLSGQIHSQTGNNLSLQQHAILPNPHQFQPSSSPGPPNPPGFNRPPQIRPLPNAQNPNFRLPSRNIPNNNNTHISNFNGSNPNNQNPMPPHCFPNRPNAQFVNQTGVSPQFGAQLQPQNFDQIITSLQVLQQNLPQFQGPQNLMGQLQNNNTTTTLMQPGGMIGNPNMQVSMHNPSVNGAQIASSQFNQNYQLNNMQPLNFPQPPRPLMASTGSHNPGFAGIPQMTLSHNPHLVGNPQMPLSSLSSNLGDASGSNVAMQRKNQDHRLYAAPNIVGHNAAAAQGSTSAFLKSQMSPPVSPFPMKTHQRPNNMQQKAHSQPRKSVHGYGKRGTTNARFSNSQFRHMKNTKGPQNRRASGQPLRCPDFPERSHPEHTSPPVKYTEKQIRQWCEARKKNYPTRAKVEKEFDGGNRDEEIKLRRKELKQVLAKQKELGCEVADIPRKYLYVPKDQLSKPKFTNKCDKRKGRGRDVRNPKRPKTENNESDSDTGKEMEPTLLKKLLRSQIKRDKSRLLQVFRFMLSNSFFQHFPVKPLEFPRFVVKGEDYESDDVHADADGLDACKSAISKEIESETYQTVENESDGDLDDEDDADEVDNEQDDGEDGEIVS